MAPARRGRGGGWGNGGDGRGASRPFVRRGGRWSVPRWWPGRTVVCIASGPSLSDRDIEIVRNAREADRCRVIVVNRSYERARWADILYGADVSWWRAAANAPGFHGLKVCVEEIEFRDVLVLGYRDEAHGLSCDPDALHCGGNSGYQAVNLAVLLGASTVALLGYDMRFGPHGEKHWHPDHVGRNPEDKVLARWAREFETMLPDLERAGTKVVNCTATSAIECFSFADISEVL